MENLKIRLSYWIYPEGDDFEEMESFKKELSAEYEIEIKSERTDALGGGLYEFVMEIISDINFADFAKDYVEDGIKIAVGYFWKPIFKKIKELFKKNEKYKPDIEVAKFIFKDLEIIIYPLYQKSIDQVIDEVIEMISKHLVSIKNQASTQIKSIHVPIFNYVDNYEVCAYRVKLNVDENIPSFNKADYFKFWGIRCLDKTDFIYDVKNRTAIKTKFYTQTEYDVLLDKKFKAEQ